MTEKKNWLSENIVSLIALTIIGFAFTVFLLVLLREVKTTESTTITILASITNILMLIIGFYFGSSKTSKEQGKQITDMVTSKEPIKPQVDEVIKTDTTNPTT